MKPPCKNHEPILVIVIEASKWRSPGRHVSTFFVKEKSVSSRIVAIPNTSPTRKIARSIHAELGGCPIHRRLVSHSMYRPSSFRKQGMSRSG